jgi:hypothetical protein
MFVREPLVTPAAGKSDRSVHQRESGIWGRKAERVGAPLAVNRGVNERRCAMNKLIRRQLALSATLQALDRDRIAEAAVRSGSVAITRRQELNQLNSAPPAQIKSHGSMRHQGINE